MTKPCYPKGCAAGSEDRGLASSPYADSPGDYAWNVNFWNGNANYNDHDNHGFVRAVRSARSGEYHDAVDLQTLYTAWREARRGKRPSRNQLGFDARWIDGLLALQAALSAGTWRPRPPTSFVAVLPKAREIHAPDFSDRIVHHWLVPQLEAIYEPIFIHDCYSNRREKGTHAAVERLRGFIREVEHGEGGGWYLQLDIANFFNSICRPTLYRLLKARMARRGIRMAARRAAHALVSHSPTRDGVIYASSQAERARVPAHKQLANSAPGCGIAIGNLSSQFFANVYLNELDQFVKHDLRARRYLRYVDDFVLVHRSREQLKAWQRDIEGFLADRLQLRLKDEVRLRPLPAGVDFLGYLTFPTHTLVRRRVISHARAKLGAWQRRHVRHGAVSATPAQFRALRAVWASYSGHFRHADSWRLHQDFERRYPWLRAAASRRRFHHRLEGRRFHLTPEVA